MILKTLVRAKGVSSAFTGVEFLFNCMNVSDKMGPLETAKKIAAYKAIDEYVKVIYILFYLIVK